MKDLKIGVIASDEEKKYDSYFHFVPPCPVSMMSHIEMTLSNKARIMKENIVCVDLYEEEWGILYQRDESVSIRHFRDKLANKAIDILVIETRVLELLGIDDVRLSVEFAEAFNVSGDVPIVYQIDSDYPDYYALAEFIKGLQEEDERRLSAEATEFCLNPSLKNLYPVFQK